MYMIETIQKHGKYMYTYYQNTHTLQNPHIHTPAHYKTRTYTHPNITKPTNTYTPTLYKTHTYINHILQNKLKQPQYKLHTNRSAHFSQEITFSMLRIERFGLGLMLKP